MHVCKGHFTVLGNCSAGYRLSALAWARSLDLVAELGRPRPLPSADFAHSLPVLQATTSALASIYRVILNDFNDLAGWHILSLFHILVHTPIDREMLHDSASYQLHIIACCERIKTGDWQALLADANASQDEAADEHGYARPRRAADRQGAHLREKLLRLVGRGKLGRAMEALRNAFHPADAPGGAALERERRAKHPAANAPIPPLPANILRFALSLDAF